VKLPIAAMQEIAGQQGKGGAQLFAALLLPCLCFFALSSHRWTYLSSLALRHPSPGAALQCHHARYPAVSLSNSR
jgi:hypothetical protein